MAIKLTVNSFLKVLRQSQLLSADKVDSLLDRCAADGVEISDAAEIARWLADRGDITVWQGDKLLQGKHKGYRVGKYLLKDLIGRGGMSTVFLANHMSLGSDVAIKVLPQTKVHDTSYLERFKREARAAASVDHPNIVRAFDIDMVRDGKHEIHFIVMEYVDGRDLTEIIVEEGLFEPAAAAEIIRQTADALQHAHDVGIVHRDMKPGNLMIEASGTVRLLDLGLARFFEDEAESLTIMYDERVLGTADYLAPEQAFDSHTVDARADIYGLGCTFYFLLTGHPPFNEGTLPQRLLAHQTKQPPPIRNERPDITDSLLAIIERMMEKDPDNRHQTAGEVSQIMSEWLRTTAKQTKARTTGLGPRQGASKPQFTPFGESSVLRTATETDEQPAETQKLDSLETRIIFGKTSHTNTHPIPKNLRQRMMLTAVAVLAMTAIVMVAAIWLPNLISPKLEPLIHVGPDREFQSINAAIQHVEGYIAAHGTDRNLQTIRVDGGHTYSERIVIDNSKLNRNFGLHIVCTDSDPAILNAEGPQPLLRVIRSENFLLSGFVLTNRNSRTVIELSEHSPGTKLNRLIISDFSGQAIFASELSGEESSGAVVLNNIHFRSALPDAVGLVLQSQAQYGSKTAVRITESQFNGEMRTGIIVNGSANGVQIDRCIFSKCRTGIRFTGNHPDLMDVRIIGNTFHQLENGIVFDESPSADSHDLVIARNLFADTMRAEAAIREPNDRSAFERFSDQGFRYNWTSDSVGIDELNIFANQGRTAISDFAFESLDAAHPGFLRPTTTSLPLTVGHPEPGFKAWIGAVAPRGL